jgi:hypothetical protein
VLLPASSSFVTGVIKERARASTLPPRLSFFRPAALVGGREEGEMEGGGGRSPLVLLLYDSRASLPYQAPGFRVIPSVH